VTVSIALRASRLPVSVAFGVAHLPRHVAGSVGGRLTLLGDDGRTVAMNEQIVRILRTALQAELTRAYFINWRIDLDEAYAKATETIRSLVAGTPQKLEHRFTIEERIALLEASRTVAQGGAAHRILCEMLAEIQQ
jgi:hypothetical protein